MYFDGVSWWTLFAAGLIFVASFWYAYGVECRDRKRRASRATSPLLGLRGQARDSRDSGAPCPCARHSSFGAHVAHLIAAEVPVSKDYLAALKRIHGRKP